MMSGKRSRKKPKYLRDEEEEDSKPNDQQQRRKRKSTSNVASMSNEDIALKPKKHKKSKKSKKERVQTSLNHVESEPSPRPGIKLKFKLGGKTVGTSVTSAATSELEDTMDSLADNFVHGFESDDVDIEGDMDDVYDDGTIINAKHKEGDETSDEEREWLEAVESGDLEDYERKKAERNPSLLTARQRALIHGETEEQLVELPTQYKNTEMTEEQLLRRKQRAVKRQQQAIEKREKAKKLTVDRLLKKQDTVVKGQGTKLIANRLTKPHCRYVIGGTSSSLSLPQGMNYPLAPQVVSEPKLPVKCGLKDCSNVKKYSCSRTHIPLCSLECYKKNLAQQSHITI